MRLWLYAYLLVFGLYQDSNFAKIVKFFHKRIFSPFLFQIPKGGVVGGFDFGFDVIRKGVEEVQTGAGFNFIDR